MAKPAILAVDDDERVLQAVQRDLRSKYGADYRIMGATSGAEGLEVLGALQLRNQPLALLLVDQRMPGMTGIEFIAESLKLFPDSRRVLLTAYADTDVAIEAINTNRLHYYLLKPWDPPEERLYPILDDQLADWQAHFHPPFEGVRVIGYRWSNRSHECKEFLGRNQIPFQWLDIETSPEAGQLLELAGLDAHRLPVLVFADGSTLVDPSTMEIAEKIGLHTRAGLPFYDLIIIGGGPAGLAAGVYGASEGLKTLMIEREAPGGQAGQSARIENYLGFPVGLSGADLARRAVTQAKRFGVEILSPQEVSGIRADGAFRYVVLKDGTELTCRALIIACGVQYRTLDVPNSDRLSGAGLYYGASASDAIDYKDQEVFMVGGGNSAGQAAMHFSKYAGKVTLLVRGDSLEEVMSQYLVDQIEATPNIAVRLNVEVTAVDGEQRLESITLRDRISGESETIPGTAMFVFIGARPWTEWATDLVACDRHGFILAGPDVKRLEGPKRWRLERDPLLLETTAPGIFVAGDVRFGSIKRVASGVGEGSMAVRFVHEYLAMEPTQS